MTPQARACPPPAPAETFYTPERLRWIILHWDDVRTLAESPTTARGLISPRPTAEEPKTARQRGRHSDGTRWAAVVADVELALASLRYSLEWRIIFTLLYTYVPNPPHPPRHPSLAMFRDAHRMRSGDVYDGFARGVARMAEHLGWVEPASSDALVGSHY